MRRTVASLVLLFLSLNSFSQARGLVSDLEALIKANKFVEAKAVLDERVPRLFAGTYPDTLISYPKYVGKIAAKLTNDDNAIKEVQAFLEKARQLKIPANILLKVFMEGSQFYSLKGKNPLAYENMELARKHTAALMKTSPADAALAESELGVYAYRMGNIGLSALHHRKATAVLETISVPNYERLYNTYNSMGTIMWFSSKSDSGIYFFDKAVTALNKLNPTPENKYYRVGIVQNNIAQLYNEQGNTARAIQTMEQSILNYRLFLASKEPNPKKEVAMVRQYEAIDNLARIYRQLGDFSKAEYLLTYSYRQKLKFLPARGPDAYKSVISLGSLYFEQMNSKKAEQYLTDGLAMVNAEASPSLLWAGEACNALSRVYDAMGNKELAARYFRMTDSLYELSLQGQYDETYLDFLRESSGFYARQQQKSLAIAKARKGYDYIVTTQGKETLSAFYQVLNLGHVEYELGNYPAALNYSRDAIAIVNKRISASTQLLDSVKAELSKPSAILLGARSGYKLLKPDNIAGLKALLSELTEALAVIQRKKAIIKDAGDITLMMSQQKDLLDFTKEIQVRLYELTGEESLIDQVIDLHETAIYNRIRSRFDKQHAVRFAEVPIAVQKKEEELMNAVTASLKAGRNEADGIQRYITAESKWKQFQEMLRKEYPRYYAMRYADIKDRSVRELSAFVPDGVTVVRFLNIGKEFYALVADKKAHHWIALNSTGAEGWIRALADASQDPVAVNGLCYNLYKALWQPLEKYISTTRVLVIPDGPLYYLSFDMLTTSPGKTFSDLAAKSLLSRYAISYHYSFFALGSNNIRSKKSGNFAAFVPGFSDDVKKEYVTALKSDSLRMDNEYLTLLPLPFSVDLARRMQGKLGGTLFVGDESTPGAFRSKAGNHAIIHIGTHAEANNLNPEYSRLIFAKDPGNGSDSNSVYLYDIYDYNLGSDLTVLTACETGRPGLNDGEGMISMAHAFNYAGSESILTGLWKIDEKASCIITDYFYRNLQDGMPKDVALQKAKLAYLSSAKGRMLSPQYWAGLVIMGDPSPVNLQKGQPWLIWSLIAGLIILVLAVTWFRTRNKRRTLTTVASDIEEQSPA